MQQNKELVRIVGLMGDGKLDFSHITCTRKTYPIKTAMRLLSLLPLAQKGLFFLESPDSPATKLNCPQCQNRLSKGWLDRYLDRLDNFQQN